MLKNVNLIIKSTSGEKYIFSSEEWDIVNVDNPGVFVKVIKNNDNIFYIKKDSVFTVDFKKVEPPKKSPVSGWIPIDEKRPAPEEEVLVCNTHGVIFIGERADFLGKNIFVDSAKSMSTTAAAWMPLPEKYKGAVDNG